METTSFVCTNRINLLDLELSSESLVFDAKGFLKLLNVLILIKRKTLITSQKRDSHDFWRIANNVLKKDKSAISLLINGPDMLSYASDKAKLFDENFSKNSNLDDSHISLHAFPSRTNLRLHNIHVTPKLVKKVIINLDLSNTSGPDCISLVFLKKCEPGISYILAELFDVSERILFSRLLGFICVTVFKGVEVYG